MPSLLWSGGLAAAYLGFRWLRARAHRIEAGWENQSPTPSPSAQETDTPASLVQIATAHSDGESPPTTPVATVAARIETSEKPSSSPALPIPIEALPPPVATTSSSLQFCERFCWTAFWAVLAFPFLKSAAVSLTGSWETISNAPGDILGGSLKDISSFSPYFALALLALALGFIVCRVKAKPEARGTFLRARLLLLLIAAVGAAVFVRQVAFTADDVFRRGGAEIPADDTAFRDTMLAELGRATLSTDFDMEITSELDAGNVERARILVGAADLLGRNISPAVRARYEEDASFWSFDNLARNGQRCLAGGFLRESETITHIACMVAVDFMRVPLLDISMGDTLDLGFQLFNNQFNHEPIDPTIAGLAAAGIAIDLLFPSNDEVHELEPAMSAVKAGIRASKRLKMAPRMEKSLRRMVSDTVDPDAIRNISPWNFKATAKQAFRPEGFAAFRPVLDDLYAMYRDTGYLTTPILALKHADEVSELRHFRRMSRLFGKNADGVIELIGKTWKRAFWKAGKAGAKATVKLAVWYSGLAASLTAFLIALSTHASAGLMRRLILIWARRKAITPA